LNYHKDKLSVKQIKDFIVAKAPPAEKQKWQQTLSMETVGLLLNERLINVPSALAPSLHETIYEEIQWALEDGHPFNFDTFVYVTSYSHPDHQQRKKKKVKTEKQWFKPEDAVYLKHSTLSFEASVNHSETKVFMVFPAKTVPALLNDIKVTILEEYCW